MDYLYDETFEGFLNCVYHHYYTEKAEGIFPVSRYQTGLLTASRRIETDSEIADRVYLAIQTKISLKDLERIYRVFGASAPEKEMMLLRYIRLGFREGPNVSLLHGHPVVFAVQQAEHRVGFEIHKFIGIVRFSAVRPKQRNPAQKQKEILYCPIEPDHDIIEFLAEHFCDRLKEEAFIIHDRRRGKALISAAGRWYITEFSDTAMLELTSEEIKYRSLWKEYFDTIAIKERANPVCQRRCMPVRYWKNLTEYRPLHTL